MGAELLAALRPYPIEDIGIGGQTFRIPAYSADRWLEALLQDRVRLTDIIPGMLEPDAEDAVTEALIDGTLTREELENLVWEVVAIASGREWWSTLMLIGNAKHPQYVDHIRGQLALHRIDATKMSLAAWVDAIYAIFTQNMGAEDRQKFQTMLARPPAGVSVKIDSRKRSDNFRAVMMG